VGIPKREWFDKWCWSSDLAVVLVCSSIVGDNPSGNPGTAVRGCEQGRVVANGFPFRLHVDEVDACRHPAFRAPIWVWMYIINVLPVHRPIFMMVLSFSPDNLRAIAPEAPSEWDSTRVRLYPWAWRLVKRAAWRISATISELVTCLPGEM
jgi:hypothetical protein